MANITAPAPEGIRDPKTDHLLSPENAVLAIIDFQPLQVSSVKSRDQKQMVSNVEKLTKIAHLFNIPVVVSTVRVSSGQKSTIDEIMNVLGEDHEQIDRTGINAWENPNFKAAIEATGRKKLLIAGLWTEACVTFPTLDALQEGYEVYPVTDAMGGTSVEAHDAALQRMESAGAELTTWVQVACELQRDWAREDTAGEFAKILFDK
ncbi:hydrolase [Rothia aerolata]|uniref:Hydrolase n=1 Tax=Rothia aerolata TaxID=1812262 RepID=A0A917INV2_9MICC|nr:hydrolase [Rothia aerolata]GGH58223.1 hydrolase [Rothia aerolata]